ncbi:MAG: FAD-binding protein [Firmicutes bacterium]|nr:FAD-binding protein [Bacillota bacterium]
MINIVGAGLAGLSAAITAAQNGHECRLISKQPSERAQSVLAEGGINAALDTMGENDTPREHFEDTMRGGVYLADPNAVEMLTKNAPEILLWLTELGAGFNMCGDRPLLRKFGGQKKKRTAFAKSSTGKIIMTALIDEARKYEARGLIHRYPHHELCDLCIKNGRCTGLVIRDIYSGEILPLGGAAILACGGLNGFFEGKTTGTTQNDGTAAVIAFARGVEFANLEFIQYHPTTIGISGKRCLISEAARGEGGRLFARINGERVYFMEDKYPELGNLMPRDIVSRESYMISRRADCDGVFLDMTKISEDVWSGKLSDLRKECIYYLSLDLAKEYIPVEPAIHYFMGGINTDIDHKTNIEGLYAAGECASQYHGANRLGGNSMLGALYGGKTAALNVSDINDDTPVLTDEKLNVSLSPDIEEEAEKALYDGLGIVRDEKTILGSLERLEKLGDNTNARLAFAKAILNCALERRESRGAHFRADHPETKEIFKKTTVVRAERKNGEYITSISFRDTAGKTNENKA